MRRLRSILGYGLAALVLGILLLSPFVLFSRFSGLVGGLGLRPHPKYAGGPVVRTLDRGAYRVEISAIAQPVGRLESKFRFVQVAWRPLSALPPHIEEELDLDGDGRADVRVAFEVPKDPKAPLLGHVQVLDAAKVQPIHELRRDDLSALLVRLEDRIVARIPMK
ncbi:MAG TPA: hypothetical protein PKL14_01440 [Holophaga sp.]|mgnify:CR=1 FL=1|nr:hypothetical protein [Holophaga sp.]